MKEKEFYTTLEFLKIKRILVFYIKQSPQMIIYLLNYYLVQKYLVKIKKN